MALATVLIAGGASQASAQSTSRLVRADLAGTAGWLWAGTDGYSPRDSKDWHASLFGAASAGWYWTDHVKTEVDVGAGNRARAYRYRSITIDDRPNYVSSEYTFERRILGVSQQYQFFRNAWFHPHIGAGANFTWERSTEHFNAVVVSDLVSPRRVLIPERTEGPQTRLTVRPFVAAGFKAYMTPRTFFRSDARVGLRGGADEVTLRFGFGVDF